MIRRLTVLAVAVGLALCVSGASEAGAARPPKVGILLDGSQSMEGYFRTRAFFWLHDQIARASEGARYRKFDYVFMYNRKKATTTRHFTRSGWRLSSLGKWTYIDRAYSQLLRRHPGLDLVWLVTDNVQDPHGKASERGDIRRFYKKLTNRRVKRLYVFPKSLRFRGPLFRRDSSRLAGYRGRRGLVVYAILLRSAGKDFFENSQRRFARSIGFPRGSGILMKGFDEPGLIEAEVAPDENSSRTKRLYMNNGRLVSMGIYNEREPVNGSFAIRFHSNLDNVIIIDPAVDARVSRDFILADFTADDPKLVARPEVIPTLAPQGQSPAVSVSASFPKGVRLVVPWASPGSWSDWGPLRRALMRQGRGNFAGAISVGVTARQRQFQLPSDVLKAYSTNSELVFTDRSPNPGLHKRVFGLNRLFTVLTHGRRVRDKEYRFDSTYPVSFKVRYPVWPMLWLIVLVVLAVAAGGAVWWMLSGSPTYLLAVRGSRFNFERQETSASSGSAPPLARYKSGSRVVAQGDPLRVPRWMVLPLVKGVPVLMDGVPVAHIRRSWRGGCVAVAVPGHLVNDKKLERLDPTGSTVLVSQGSTPAAPSERGRGPVPERPRPKGPDAIYKK